MSAGRTMPLFELSTSRLFELSASRLFELSVSRLFELSTSRLLELSASSFKAYHYQTVDLFGMHLLYKGHVVVINIIVKWQNDPCQGHSFNVLKLVLVPAQRFGW
jgi:hypothetical protein